jgi:hypothetical protein
MGLLNGVVCSQMLKQLDVTNIKKDILPTTNREKYQKNTK